jgi:hypothetical protein
MRGFHVVSIDLAAEGVRRAFRDRQRRASTVTLIILVLISGQLALRAWAVYGGWFFGDDLIFLSDVHQGNADLEWLLHRHNVHFMPFGFLLAMIVGKAGAFAWGAAATELLILQAVASFCCWWMLRTLFGNRLRIIPPLAFYLFATISMPALMWWASGIELIPLQIGIFVAITTHVLYLRTRLKRFAIFAALALCFALLCYVKALLLPVVLAIVAVVYFATGSPLSRVLTSLRTYWFAWLLYAVPCAVYVALYTTHGDPSPPATGGAEFGRVADDLLVSGLATAPLGGPWKWIWYGPGVGPRYMADPPAFFAAFAVLAILLTLVVLAIRYRNALHPLWFVVPYAAATYGLLVLGRGVAFGPAATRDIRYWTDFLPYAALAIGLLFMPLIGATTKLTRRELLPDAVRPRPWMYGAAAVLFLAMSVYSTVTYVKPWHGDFDTRRFIENAERELAAQPKPVAIADELVPEGVMYPLGFPYNKPSNLLAGLKDEFTVPSVATDLQVLDFVGSIKPGIVSNGITAPDDELATCIDGGGIRTVTLESSTLDYPFWLSVTYRATGDGRLQVTAGDNVIRGPIEDGEHTLFVRTEGVYDAVRLFPSASTKICVDVIRIGPNVVPAP